MNIPGWIAVDLDGTLAKYDEWKGPDHIGEPVPSMLHRVIGWLAQGVDVRIFTARVCPNQPDGFATKAHSAIDAWCLKHIGRTLPVTATKDYKMIALYDDRAVRVQANTGKLLSPE